MTKRFKQKYRICKQIGEDLWGKLNKKINYNVRSGQHGKIKKKRKEIAFIYKDNNKKKINTVNKTQFIYKLRKFYSNISKKQFDNLFKKGNLLNANNKYNTNSKYLINLLERRLDTILFRINWASSFFNARQLINHGHILINGNIVNVSSHLVNIGDKIEVKKDSQKLLKKNLIDRIKNKQITINCPSYIEVNYNILCAIVIFNPTESFVPFPTIKNISQLKYLYL
uniref:Ribosomal protein S4 n=1 Tax=Malawimonas jakobiformis TaxID=136089 RepID=Q9G884_MALJA|nr:ribosomal protein S4 [Malawimonas jakobiformis]AAG13689.1 ribosomal protein S4 [Malawimonas jakobiformis]